MKTDKELDLECRKQVFDRISNHIFSQILILLEDRVIDQEAFQVSEMRKRIEAQVWDRVKERVNDQVENRVNNNL